MATGQVASHAHVRGWRACLVSLRMCAYTAERRGGHVVRGMRLSCNMKREGGASLEIIKERAGQSLVRFKGKGGAIPCNIQGEGRGNPVLYAPASCRAPGDARRMRSLNERAGGSWSGLGPGGCHAPRGLRDIVCLGQEEFRPAFPPAVAHRLLLN